jgi:glycosyltransferase involved in cell wall biosynthesis
MECAPVRIAMIAPPWYQVPPDGYGGIESLVAHLVDGLVGRGHDVLLVCAGASRTAAQTVCTTMSEAPSRLLADESVSLLHAERAEEAIRDFAPDIVHDHTLPGLLAAGRRPVPTVATAHGALVGAYGGLLERPHGARVVAISRSQRDSCPAVPWYGVVHNGVPVADFPFQRHKDDYLLFLGRMDPDKGVVQAIEVAERSRRRLVIAARMHGHNEEAFFRTCVRPRLGDLVEYVGEVGVRQKLGLLARASALLFPLQWDEPYGLVVAEAQACGTPVLSLRRGAIPEIVVDGETALLADHHDDLVDAVKRVRFLSPDACRRFAASTLDISHTVRGYEDVYEQAVHEQVVAGHDLAAARVRRERRIDLPARHAATTSSHG